MHNVVALNQMSPDHVVLRRLPHLSPKAMRYVLGLVSFQYLSGVNGIVRVSSITNAHGLKPINGVLDELMDAGVMTKRPDGVVLHHPVVLAMMLPTPRTWRRGNHDNVVPFDAKRKTREWG